MSFTRDCQWADLPRELLEMIGRCLDRRVEVLRFRSVCTSWRSSVPLPNFDDEIPPLILNLPHPISAEGLLLQTNICRLQLLHQNQTSTHGSSSSSSSSSSSGSSTAWLVEVCESKHGKLKLFHPLSHHGITKCPVGLNLLDVRLVQLCKAFSIKMNTHVSFPVYGVNKIVLFPSLASCRTKEFAILAIFHHGKLGYWKYGSEDWKVLDENNFEYDDIIERKGQFYVVDRCGTVSWISSSLEVIQYSPPLYGCGGQKNLVESCGDLYVVDRYLDGKRRTWDADDVAIVNSNRIRIGSTRRMKAVPKAVDFRVYKLDEEWGKWVDVKSLDDRVFFLDNDCSFSLSIGEFAGGKSNCIYFSDDDKDYILVFQLEDHSIEKLELLPQYSQIFWSPQQLLSTSQCLSSPSM